MARRLDLTIEGEIGKISFETFATVMRNSCDILTNLDSAISSQPRGSSDWVVSGVSLGSLVVSIESKPRQEGVDFVAVDFGAKVVESFVGGLRQIQLERTTPPFFSDYDLRKAQGVARSLRKDGAKALMVRDVERQDVATIKPESSVDLSQLITVRYKETGSVEGKLEMISIHGAPRFTVYHAITQHSMRCKFDPHQFLDAVKEALGRRVIVSGLVYFNFKHEPIRVEIEDIKTLPRENELPTPGEIRGMVPDFTGNLPSESYVRSLRE